jgi:nicotinamidase/pyrazinamidase
VKGTPGADLLPEAVADRVARVTNDADATIPNDLNAYQQILLEKQTLDIFESRHADEVVERLPRDAEFVVFGVVTEFCVNFAARGLLQRGRKVAIVVDAIETLNPQEGEKMIADLQRMGARLTTTDEALSALCG